MKHKKIVLKNGLRVVLVPMKGNQTVTAMILVEAGSNYEPKDKNGLSHFLEHMCFKGTKKRTCADITFELDAVGAESNAFTGNEYTGYYAKAHSKRLPALLDVLSDVYLNSTFPAEEMEKEKGVIVEEINMYEDMPHRKVWEVLDSLMYGDTPAGRTILGPRETIRSMKQEDFVNYHKLHYHPQSTVVVIAGGYAEKDALPLVKKYFETMKQGKKGGKEKVKEAQTEPAIKVSEKKSDQSHLVLGFRTVGLGHKDRASLGMLSAVLGSGMSSRLFKRMRDELGICYYVRASHETYTDHGYFAISAGVANDRVEEAIKTIVEEVRKVKDSVVPADEMKKVQALNTGRLVMGHESSDSYADLYGFQELHHRPIESLDAKVKKMNKITVKDIKKVAEKYLVPECANFALVGPAIDEKKIKGILEKI
jgi:predicted Zn-dependent peptidase